MIRIIHFMRLNREKGLTLQVWLWAACFRLLLRFVPIRFLKKHFGAAGEESPEDESIESYTQARKIAYHVNRISDHTPWESKCLVRALTAQRLLTKKKISSTLYLGVKKENSGMIAHAWIRTGSYYAAGGDGSGYAVVAKFRK